MLRKILTWGIAIAIVAILLGIAGSPYGLGAMLAGWVRGAIDMVDGFSDGVGA